ncbi:hypothetical protein BASA50_000217 [Batrachochytrium salamandrivorans]|uniref:Reverse transcriptase zinc-binding domain-containing protein n=1 Tax=Batrachochytrium salamandrivorans TaxID=1357716 RepID=A0ABQ8EUL3_9FUNG|nr:hypothetical protein BASA50_000217 [Batrachochytrium salamandrivorans]
MTKILLGWKEGKSSPLKSSNPPSIVSESKAGDDELGTPFFSVGSILVDTHPFSADHCILCNQQLLSTSIAHLVVECEQVNGHRIQSGLVPAIQKSRLRFLGRSTRSGCGECIYLAPRWSLKRAKQIWTSVGWTGTVEQESMGTRHDNRMLAARLADFLQVAYWQYQSTLWKYHRDRLVEVG